MKRIYQWSIILWIAMFGILGYFASVWSHDDGLSPTEQDWLQEGETSGGGSQVLPPVDLLVHVPINLELPQAPLDYNFVSDTKIITMRFDGAQIQVQGSDGIMYQTYGHRMRIFENQYGVYRCERGSDHLLYDPNPDVEQGEGWADLGIYLWSENANWGNNRGPGPDSCGDPATDSNHSHYDRFIFPPDPKEGWVWTANDPVSGIIKRFQKMCYSEGEVVPCADLKDDITTDFRYDYEGGYTIAAGCQDSGDLLQNRGGHRMAVRTKHVDVPGEVCGQPGVMLEKHPVLFISGCHTIRVKNEKTNDLEEKCKTPWSDGLMAIAIPHQGQCENSPLAGFNDDATVLAEDDSSPEDHIAWYSTEPIPPERDPGLSLSSCRDFFYEIHQ